MAVSKKKTYAHVASVFVGRLCGRLLVLALVRLNASLVWIYSSCHSCKGNGGLVVQAPGVDACFGSTFVDTKASLDDPRESSL